MLLLLWNEIEGEVMLVKNVGGERAAALMVKDSKFYIDLAKFVQAYLMIVSNPNDFLKEVQEPEIDPANDHLTWAQFVKIMQTCDLGFEFLPDEKYLVVLYNYALEMGSIGHDVKRIASVEDVANAQKHFYNFIDDSTDKAEMELAKQQEILSNRDREAQRVDNELAKLKAKNITCLVFMVLGVLSFAFGLISLFVANVVANAIGGFVSSYKNIVGGVILMCVGILLFASLNGAYLKTKYAFLRLKDASKTIFKRSDLAYNDTLVLKNKLNGLKEDLKVVKSELADKNKTNDVMKNMENLAETNKFYKQFVGGELLFESASSKPTNTVFEEFEPVKLSKEEHEDVRQVSKEAINLTGTFDEEAYNAKFEKSRTKDEVLKEEQAQKEAEEKPKIESQEPEGELNKQEIEKLKEIDEEQKQSEEENLKYLKDIMGLD